MTVWEKIIGMGIGSVAKDVAEAVDRFVETPEEKKAAQVLFDKIKQAPDRWNAEINKIEASHRSVFVAGWRPAVGWVCAIALCVEWVVTPIIKMFNSAYSPAAINSAEAITLILSLLGMATLRTAEKMKNVTK